MFESTRKMRLLCFLLTTTVLLPSTIAKQERSERMMEAKEYFSGLQLHLAEAIDANDGDKVQRAVMSGADVNGSGKQGVTPLMFALVGHRDKAVVALLKRGADPNARADNGHSGMTLATRLAPTDLTYLRLVLQHGGAPNARGPDRDPILIDLIGQGNNGGIRLLAASGADLNIESRTGRPAIIVAGLIDHWDSVWTLIELGADWNVRKNGQTIAWSAHTSNVRADSPIYPWLAKTVEFLKGKGVHFPPPSPAELRNTGQSDFRTKQR
jgi:ankyrin repeat protein